jgi:hypothetical protein
MLDDEGVGLKGFSYNPLFLADPRCNDMPVTDASNCSDIVNDDVSAEWAGNMWNSSGRDDIGIMSSLGANTVRLYGNDPRFSKRKFMNYALEKKMKVVTGLSNYPYVNTDNGCIHKPPIGKNFDCFDTIKEHYGQVISVGEFAEKNGYYHNSLEVISLFNEPDIHMWTGGWSSPNNYILGLITAFDGFLSAEKEAGIKPWKNGRLPKITISWSYAVLNQVPCDKTGYINNKSECGAAIGFMSQFYNALNDLNGTVQYSPKNDLKKAYTERWITSLQTFVTAEQVYREVISKDVPAMKGLKVYFGEYDPAVDLCGEFKPECDRYGKSELLNDLKTILTDSKWAKAGSLGVSFFSYTEADNKRRQGEPYSKNHELQYGLFNFTKQAPWKTGYIVGDKLPNHAINCLGWKVKDFGEAIANVYGGQLPALDQCPSVSGGVLPVSTFI